MFVEQLRRAVEMSPRCELTKVSALLWKAYAASHVTEAEASALSEAIELKRALPPAQKPVQRRLIGSRPRSPASLERRRRWAASGALPPALASRFTTAEQSVLAVIAAEHRKRGDCRLTNKEVADVAGVSITTVKNALRAARENLISIEERRLTAFRNASNIVRIVSPEWRAWLRLGGGGKSVPRSPTAYKNQRSRPSERTGAAEGKPI